MQSCILVKFSLLQGDFLHCYSDIILFSERIYSFACHVNEDLPATGFSGIGSWLYHPLQLECLISVLTFVFFPLHYKKPLPPKTFLYSLIFFELDEIQVTYQNK